MSNPDRRDEVKREVDRVLGREVISPYRAPGIAHPMVREGYIGQGSIVAAKETRRVVWNAQVTMAPSGYCILSPYASRVELVAVGNQIVSGLTPIPSKVFKETVCKHCGREWVEGEWNRWLSFGVRWSPVHETIKAGFPIQYTLHNDSPEEQSIVLLFRGLIAG